MIKLLFIPILFLNFLFANNKLTKEELTYIENKKYITVSNEFDYEPYDFNRNGRALGYSIDLLKLILKDTNLEIRYSSKPWNQLLKDLDDEKIDLIHTIYKTKEREKTMTFSLGYSKVIQSYIIRENEKEIVDIEDLFSKKVGISKGWGEEEFFKKYPEIDLVYLDNIEDKLNALSLGKIDAIINSDNVANYYIKKYGYNNLKISNPVKNVEGVKLDDHHFATLKKNSILISIIDKSYDNTSIEEIEKLNKKWFGKNSISNTIFNEKEKNYINTRKSVNLCIDPDWLPYESLDKNGNHIGLSADYFKLFTQESGLIFNTIKTESWSQSIEYIKDKKCDMVSFITHTKEREKFFNFTSSYLKIPIVIATKLDISFIDDFKNLENRKIALVKDYGIAKKLKEKYPNLNIEYVDNISEGLSLVAKGKVFGYVDSFATISYALQSEQRIQLKIAGEADIYWNLSAGVRKDEPILVNIIQKLIDDISAEEKQKIFNNWIVIKYEKGINYSLIWKILLFFSIIFLLFLYKQYLMRKSINEFSQLIDSTMEAILIFKDNRLINSNESAVKIFSFIDKNQMKGLLLDEFISKESKDLLYKQRKNNEENIEILSKRKDGTKFYALFKKFTLKDKNINVISLIDITHIKQLESQTKQAQMGEMIENIAHQWRQPLSSISTISSGISLNIDLGEKPKYESISEDMNKIVDTTKYLSNTIDTFRNFLKERKELRDVVLHDRLKLVISIVTDSLKSRHILLKNNIKDENFTFTTIVGELDQVLINIINNAKDAIKEKDIKEPWIELNLEKNEKNFLITIEDNAKGIPENIIDKIFDPYFTTKHKSQGTGLGLHMSYKIVTESLRGKLYVQNTNNGAKFFIEIPYTFD
ncbi:MAG: transporter substrate-binding domain-containing protein [Campylobacteraceae bacterium]|nr:transporter substrate-binding domain-containing protein [Campylobacteraceae bacterium]